MDRLKWIRSEMTCITLSWETTRTSRWPNPTTAVAVSMIVLCIKGDKMTILWASWLHHLTRAKDSLNKESETSNRQKYSEEACKAKSLLWQLQVPCLSQKLNPSANPQPWVTSTPFSKSAWIRAQPSTPHSCLQEIRFSFIPNMMESDLWCNC